HRVHGDVLRGDVLVAHPARHPQALEDPARGGAAADGARRTVLLVHTVRGAQAVEAVALHHTGEALALAGGGDVDPLAGLEGPGAQLLAQRVLAGVGGAQLQQVAPRRHASLVEVTAHRLGHLAGVDLAEGDLDAVVPVAVRGANPGDNAGAGLDHGDGD